MGLDFQALLYCIPKYIINQRQLCKPPESVHRDHDVLLPIVRPLHQTCPIQPPYPLALSPTILNPHLPANPSALSPYHYLIYFLYEYIRMAEPISLQYIQESQRLYPILPSHPFP